MRIPKTGDDMITPRERMRNFPVRQPSDKGWGKIASFVLGLTAISIAYSRIAENHSEKPEILSPPLSKLLLPKAEQVITQYQTVNFHDQDILTGRSVLRLGDQGLIVKRFLQCFPELTQTYAFDRVAERVVMSYQMNNLLPQTGQIDLLTVEKLKADNIISYEASRDKLELGDKFFPKVINPERKADCLLLAQRFLLREDQFGHAHSIENYLISSGSYLKVVTNALEVLAEKYPQVVEASQVVKRLELIQEALMLGIPRPLMYTNYNLGKLVANYKNPHLDGFNACLVITSYDHNGAFYGLRGVNELTSFFLSNHANVRIVMPRKDYEIGDLVTKSLVINGQQKQGDFVAYFFHGFSTGFQIARGNSAESRLEMGEGHLRKLNPILDGATEILFSCSTANPEYFGHEHTLAQSLYDARGKRSQIIAPRTDCNFLIGRYVDEGTGSPIRIDLPKISEPLFIKFIAPQLTGKIPHEIGKYPQAAVTRLRAVK